MGSKRCRKRFPSSGCPDALPGLGAARRDEGTELRGPALRNLFEPTAIGFIIVQRASVSDSRTGFGENGDDLRTLGALAAPGGDEAIFFR